MLEKIDQIAALLQAETPQSSEETEQFRIKYLSKKGLISLLFEDFKLVPGEQKKAFGQKLNVLKQQAQEMLEQLQAQFASAADSSLAVDPSLPGEPRPIGSRHPVTLVREQIIGILSRLGFAVAEGPEIEDDWHVFSALNFPEEHPAREMQDTFFVEGKDKMLLRTHTSSVQIRVMETQKPPIRALFPGRVYRNEAISARSHCFFHQIEGLYIDKDVSFADLRQTLLFFAQEMFGANTRIRLRPSYFPFTEPSAEMDISCSLCGGSGCGVCKHSGWVEILGCGMVDPNVLTASGIDSNEYSGFAFGMGIERIAMLKYQTGDIRLFSENDMRYLSQFSALHY